MSENNKKSKGLAFVLWLFFGGIGVHRFYVGKTGTGVLYIVISFVGVIGSLIFLPLGLVILSLLGILLLIDLIRIITGGLLPSFDEGTEQPLGEQ